MEYVLYPFARNSSIVWRADSVRTSTRFLQLRGITA